MLFDWSQHKPRQIERTEWCLSPKMGPPVFSLNVSRIQGIQARGEQAPVYKAMMRLFFKQARSGDKIASKRLHSNCVRLMNNIFFCSMRDALSKLRDIRWSPYKAVLGAAPLFKRALEKERTLGGAVHTNWAQTSALQRAPKSKR